jgi:hypothetical protein
MYDVAYISLLLVSGHFLLGKVPNYRLNPLAYTAAYEAV